MIGFIRQGLREYPSGGGLRTAEQGLREALRRFGQAKLEDLLNEVGASPREASGQPGESRMRGQTRTVRTIFGPLRVLRTGYHHRESGRMRYPLDEAMGLVGSYTPLLAELMCRAVARGSFASASGDLLAYAGLDLDARRFHRLAAKIGPDFRAAKAALPPAPPEPVPRMYISADGTGIPFHRAELAGRAGRQPDGSARTHEVKIGCVFTQHPRPGEEEPLRDWDSTTYLATTERVGAFAPQVLAEARRRGLAGAREVVFISDGAAYLKEIVRSHFPQATWVLDFYHAAEHLGLLAAALDGTGSEAAVRRAKRWREEVLAGGLPGVLVEARASPASDTAQREAQLAYLENNKEGMRYAEFQARGLFIGSGVVEAGCKTVVGQRLKQSGMFWREAGAQAVLALRSALHSNQFEAVWAGDLIGRIRAAA